MTSRHCIWCQREIEPLSVVPCPCAVVAHQLDWDAPRGPIDEADQAYEARKARAYEREQQLNDASRAD